MSPGGARTQVMGRLADGRLKVRVAAPPERGRANAELTAFLARELGLRRGEVRVASGASSRDKVIEIDAAPERVRRWMESVEKGT